MSRVLALMLCLSLMCLPVVIQAADVYSESAVKAAYLYRFVDYVDWPRSALTGPAFVVGIFNDDEVGDELSRLLTMRTLKGMPVRVQKISDLREATNIQVLYLGSIKADDLRSVSQALAKRPILLVTNGVMESSATINFVRVTNKIRFEVSLNAAEAAGLKVDAGLLAVASKVYGVRPGFETCDAAKASVGGCPAYSGVE